MRVVSVGILARIGGMSVADNAQMALDMQPVFIAVCMLVQGG